MKENEPVENWVRFGCGISVIFGPLAVGEVTAVAGQLLNNETLLNAGQIEVMIGSAWWMGLMATVGVYDKIRQRWVDRQMSNNQTEDQDIIS